MPEDEYIDPGGGNSRQVAPGGPGGATDNRPDEYVDPGGPVVVAPRPGILSKAWSNLRDEFKAYQAVGEPVARGIRDVIDTPAQLLASVAGQGDAVSARNATDLAAYDKQYKDSVAAPLWRAGGQIAATAPLVSGIGGLAARGAMALPGAIGTAAQFLTGATPAITTAGRIAQLAAQGAGSGATQAGLTSSGYQEPVTDQVLKGAATGAALGPVLGGVTKAVDVLRGYVGGMRPEIAALADRARQMGIDIPTARLSGNPFLRQVSSVGETLPFSGADAMALRNQRQWQAAVAQNAGSTADTFGPAEMRATRDQLRAGYTAALAQVPPISGGRPLHNDLAQIGADAARLLSSDAAGDVGRAIRETANQWGGGPITADAYRSFTASDGDLAQIAKGASGAAQPFIARVQDAVRARLLAAAPPGVADDLRRLDQQYRAMKTVQPLAEKSTTGDISPGGLLERMRSQSSKYDSSNTGMAYTGGGDMGDLARIGKQFFGHIPDSGTAGRLQAYDFAQHPLATTAAAIPSLLATRPIRAALNRPAVSGRIIDTSLGGATPDIGRAIPYGLLGPIDEMRRK